jgi:hypothetical protein
MSQVIQSRVERNVGKLKTLLYAYDIYGLLLDMKLLVSYSKFGVA